MHHLSKSIFSQADLLLPTDREVFEYIEHATIHVDDGVLTYSKAQEGKHRTFSIPVMNLSMLLMGPGTSITTEAMLYLAKANVVLGASQDYGFPASLMTDPFVFSTTQSEYRPTQYMQDWAALWFDEKKRIECAQYLFELRIKYMSKHWGSKHPALSNVDMDDFLFFSKKQSIENYTESAWNESTVQQLLGEEGAHVHRAYSIQKETYGINFKRDPDDRVGVNSRLTMGNYIAYGVAATALNSLGVSFAFPLFHGKTRRGALVFDIADPIKDAIIIPFAFYYRDKDESEYRYALKEYLFDHNVLSDSINMIKDVIAFSKKGI